VPSDVVRTRIFLLGIFIFKGLTARRLYKSFGVKGLSEGKVPPQNNSIFILDCILFFKILLLILIYKSFAHAQSNQCPLHTAGLRIKIQVMNRPDVNLNYMDILLKYLKMKSDLCPIQLHFKYGRPPTESSNHNPRPHAANKAHKSK
jgi:hypothetical protein